ncbi:MAG: DUF1573 domain-containing protein [Bacteroidaceae bacterium]
MRRNRIWNHGSGRVLSVIMLMLVTTVRAQSEMQWQDGTSFNFGTIWEDDGTVSHRFVLRNAGDKAFSIVGAHATCGCTTATHSSQVIAPDDTASVMVTYNPQRREGVFCQRVAVTTDSRSRVNYLFVKGNVVSSRQRIEKEFPIVKGEIRFAEDTLYIYTREGNKKATVTMRCFNDSPDSLALSVVHLPQGADVEFNPRQPASGERFTMVVSCILKDLQQSILSGDASIRIQTDADETEPISIPINIEYRE